MRTITQSSYPIKINVLLEEHKELLNLASFLAEGIVASSGDGLINGFIVFDEPNSSFEGARFFNQIDFGDDDYIIVGHKCHMTLKDDGDRYIVTSLYVHPSKRRRGYAKRFLQGRFDVMMPIVIDTGYEGLYEAIDSNPALILFEK